MDSSSSSSSPSASSLHLAMAALVGASLMAISAFYIHKRSVDQVLDRLIELKAPNSTRNHGLVEEEEEDGEEEGEGNAGDDRRDYASDGDQKLCAKRLSRSLDERGMLQGYRMSCSVPNAELRNDWFDGDAKFRAQEDDLNAIASGFPPLRTRGGEDKSVNYPSSITRRLLTPRSPSANAFESAGDSDDEETVLAHDDDIAFNYGNMDSAAYYNVDSKFQNSSVLRGDSANSALGQDSESTRAGTDASVEPNGSKKVDSGSVSLVEKDLALATAILPIRTKLHESISAEEEEVRKMIAECLELRDRYVYREQVAPWKKETVADSSSSGVKPDPFHFEAVPASTHSFRMEDGVVHVYANDNVPSKSLKRRRDGAGGYGLKFEPELGDFINMKKRKKGLKQISKFSTHTPIKFVSCSSKVHLAIITKDKQLLLQDSTELFPVPSATAFFTDMHHLLRIMSIGNVRTECYHRLRFLEEKFRLHLLINADKEFLAQKGAPHRDFYNIRKVDTHIHHSACMNQKHLLRFIKSKLRKEPDEVVIFRDGKYMTLKEVFESLDLTGYDLNVDLLDVHADKSTFHRFDKFNLKYNPCGQSRLREIFLKQDNLIQGRFLAEVTKEVLSDLEASKYQMAEYRISIYGRKQSEWDQLASWFVNNSIYSENAVWLIQLPRLYNVYKQMGTVNSFQNILDNVFIPLFEVTVNPSSHPHLHMFLMQVVGLDMVDDESKPERRPTKHMPKPAEWTNEFNPAYSYYAYYCYANLYTLNKVCILSLVSVENKAYGCGICFTCIATMEYLLLLQLRESKGLPTIKLRPHCGEAGDIDHLAAAFLLCSNISHGINLRKSPVLQYLYYLAQIGLSMSPLSNNSLFLDYHRNPFPVFFQRGLNVSLSSDDPLQIHLTKEALVEEYSVAAKVWKLSACDLCEIARNSVYQSGFSHVAKEHWLGSKYYLRGPEGNDIHKSNVPNLRIAFRHETWKEEMQYVYSGRARFPEDVEF
ncbi:hypothetical protein Tsubulata_035090 [Turnera subulata]|uniref:AMP deaminase n=1 Tax=Turnera subulata TaxID=218843 RepID=A0A9Q0FDV7_9ROSI|nr:hypothetical protein Tsubulata_035090 [Turnera subulata]